MEVLFFFCMAKDNKDIQVVIASGLHLYPFRTEKLNLTTPMVLRNSGRVGSCRIIKKKGGEREGRKVLFSSFLLFLFSAAHDDTPSFHFPHYWFILMFFSKRISLFLELLILFLYISDLQETLPFFLPLIPLDFRFLVISFIWLYFFPGWLDLIFSLLKCEIIILNTIIFYTVSENEIRIYFVIYGISIS